MSPLEALIEEIDLNAKILITGDFNENALNKSQIINKSNISVAKDLLNMSINQLIHIYGGAK